MTLPARSERSYTFADWLAFQEDGRKREIIDGELFEDPVPPVTYHQRISKRIGFQLFAQLDEQGRGEVFHAPTDNRLTDRDVVEPDLLALGRDRLQQVQEKVVDGPPDLAVEILSPDSKHHDRRRKLALYARAGVREYWIVSPEEHVVEQYEWVDGSYQFVDLQTESIELRSIPGVRVDLTRVW